MSRDPVKVLFLGCILAACSRDSSTATRPVNASVEPPEPGIKELVARANDVLRSSGHDAACFESQVVDWRTNRTEPSDSKRPAYQLAVMFTPRGCPSEYCVEFSGLASNELDWCVDHVKGVEPTEIQRRAIAIAYARYQRQYPGIPDLKELCALAAEMKDAVHFEFVNRRRWEDVRDGRVEPSIEDGPMYLIPKKDLGMSEGSN